MKGAPITTERSRSKNTGKKRTPGPESDKNRPASAIQSMKKPPDKRRPPPGGRAGVVSTADSGGEESDRVSTVANDP